MTRREELIQLRENMDVARSEFEEDYAQLEEEIENTCDCDNCACSDECDGEFDDDGELIAEMESGELKISIIEDDDGERFALLEDLVDGERVELSEAELNTIVAMMGL